MLELTKCLESSEENVWKYIFESKECGNEAITEAILYKYENFSKRTVICCSVQSSCPVGCTFCGTGEKFIRNLTSYEIVQQVIMVLEDKDITYSSKECEKFQIMFMSMGEPMLNFDEVDKAIWILSAMYPNADLLLSTIGIDNDYTLSDLLDTSLRLKKLGLQFSIHQAFESKRDILIPFKNKMSLRKIRDYGIIWSEKTGRKVYLNYCIDGNNTSEEEINRLKDLFNPMNFAFTFSVVCSADETMKDAGYRELDVVNAISNSFVKDGYNTRVFDPAGQDDIGGGCGQLWHVQEWLDNNKGCES